MQLYVVLALVGIATAKVKETSHVGDDVLGSVSTNGRPTVIDTVARMDLFRSRQFPGLSIEVPSAGDSTGEDLLDVAPGSLQGDLRSFESDPYWSSWSDWSTCSRTCGGGVSTRSRKCLSSYSTTTPLSCNGASTDNKLCNHQDCPIGTPDFRETQCAKQNKGLFLSRNFKWIPFTGKDGNTCELTCMASNYHFYNTFGNVTDGTRCGKAGKGICIKGNCSAIGCDGVIGSDMVEDVCGVCGGNHDTCYRYQQVVNRIPAESLNSNYNKIAKIPVGSTSIKVDDYNKNYLALLEVDGEEQNYIINGNWVVSWPGEFKAAGTIVKYSRVKERETFEIKGPTTKELQIMVLCLGRQQPLVQYTYYKPTTKKDFKNSFAEFKEQRSTIIHVPREEDYMAQINAAGLDFDAVQPPTLGATTTIRTTTMATSPTKTPRQRAIARASSRTSSCSASCNKKTTNWKKQFCDSDFAVHVRVLPTRRLQRRRFTRYEVEILNTYKNARLLTREYVWVPTNCCQRLRPYRHYFLMGRKIKIRNNGGTTSDVSKKSRQYETRLLVDNSEFWYMWRKYQAKMSRVARNVNCKRYKYLAARAYRRKINKG